MAYQTGTPATLTALFDALVTFMTANGWTLFDTVNATDKVLKSNGSDGKLDMFYRLTTSESATYPIKNKPHAGQAFKYLTVRGYTAWDTVSKTGTGEYGYAGQTITLNKNNNVGYTVRAESPSYPIAPSTFSQDRKNGPQGMFDGRRKWLWSSTDYNVAAGFFARDWRGESYTFPWTGIDYHYNIHTPVLVHNYATDKDYLYWIINTATRADQHWRLDVETATWTRLNEPSWSAANTLGARGCWDGGDYVYWLRGNNSTEFARYQISTNTWTNLAAAPQLVRSDGQYLSAGNGAGSGCSYISKELSGLSQDVLFALMDITVYNAGATTIHRYDVTDNAWRNAAAGGYSATCHWGTGMVNDGERYLYHQDSGSTDRKLYRADLTSWPIAFTNLGSMDTVSDGAWRSFQHTRVLVGKVRAHNALACEYHFVGDADGVAIVTRVFTSAGVSHNYWMSFGKLTTQYQTTIATTTGALVAGPRVTIPVDSSAGLVAGQNVQIFDSTTGNTELINIYDVPDATSIRATLTKNYASGSRVGPDPVQYGIFSDHGVASMPNSANGYKADLESDWYYVGPTDVSADLAVRTASARGHILPAPMRVWNDITGFTCSRKEARGLLRNLYAVAKLTYPSPVDGDVIRVEGSDYLAFNVTEADRIVASQYMIVIGPR